MWERLDELMVQVASADEPYGLGGEVCGCVLSAVASSVDASRVYQVWAELTDRYELRPDERGETEELMRRAAREWLAASHEEAARERYLDHWLYDVCGYQRHQQPPASRREAALRELCVGLGFCDTGLTPDDLADPIASAEMVDLVLRREGLDPATTRSTLRESVLRVVEDWLFDPNGRGARSGLPR
jgi:hypothetical protein